MVVLLAQAACGAGEPGAAALSPSAPEPTNIPFYAVTGHSLGNTLRANLPAPTNIPPGAAALSNYIVAVVTNAHALGMTLEDGRRVNDGGRVAPNTPAFVAYVLPVMLAAANDMRERWGLDIPRPLSVGDVAFLIEAMNGGWNGSITTVDRRFSWCFGGGNALDKFMDNKYPPPGWSSDTCDAYNAEMARLERTKSKITAREAKEIARDHLHRLGLSEDGLGEMPDPVVKQLQWHRPLPMFEVMWRTKRYRDYADPQMAYDVRMRVSGITGQVVEYFNAAWGRPTTPTPSNYYDMLGVKPPATRRQKMGLDPLERLGTSSACGNTNSTATPSSR